MAVWCIMTKVYAFDCAGKDCFLPVHKDNDNDNDKYKEQTDALVLPIMALRGLVVFPGSVVTFDLSREKSIKALEYAVSHEMPVFLTSQINPEVDEPTLTDLYAMGVVANIKQVVRLPGQMARILVEGTSRARLLALTNQDTFYEGALERVPTDGRLNDSPQVEALVRTAKEIFERYAPLSGRLSPESILDILLDEKPGALADAIAVQLMVHVTKKQAVLEELDDCKRLTAVIDLLNEEIQVLTLQKDIYAKVKGSIDQHQKEYFLKEQMKAIQEELGGKEGIDGEIAVFRERLEQIKAPEAVVEKLEKEFVRLKRLSGSPAEAGLIRDYIDWVLDIPWSNKSRENKSLQKAEKVLNRDHYGLEDVKERLVEYLAVRQNAPKLDAPILCLVGPPGVGKTSIARSVAEALNRKYVRMSLGGVRDEAEIRGHRKTYIGAMPGRIMAALRQAGTANPLILLDELDKMSSDFRGNPGFALLEVLDSEQHVAFRDHYVELPYDLSDVLFMCTANAMDTIPDALRDRLEIITLSSYTQDEKLHIAKNHLLKKQMQKVGLARTALKVSDAAMSDTISYYTKEAGVRQLERLVGKLCRKAVKQLLSQPKVKSVSITPDNLEDYLGKRKYRVGKKEEASQVGIVKGLAWTAAGGDTLSVEASVMSGSGKVELTGHMGDVMKESAQAALSYIRSQQHGFALPKLFYKNLDMHVHIPEGAVPKDGPSAGITMATAMLSALSDIPVRNDVCMTGEITIRGRVLPIGGLKEKVLAAKRAGLSKVILPEENQRDLQELPAYIQDGMEFVLVKDMQQVLDHAFENKV